MEANMRARDLAFAAINPSTHLVNGHGSYAHHWHAVWPGLPSSL